MEDLLQEIDRSRRRCREAWAAFAETLPARLQRLLDGCARLLGDGDDGAIDGDTSFAFADFFDEKLRALVRTF